MQEAAALSAKVPTWFAPEVRPAGPPVGRAAFAHGCHVNKGAWFFGRPSPAAETNAVNVSFQVGRNRAA